MCVFACLPTCMYIYQLIDLSTSSSSLISFSTGGTGSMVRDSVRILLDRHLSFPHIRVLYPTAPLRPYTLNGGLLEHVWFDRQVCVCVCFISIYLLQCVYLFIHSFKLGHKFVDVISKTHIFIYFIYLCTFIQSFINLINRFTNSLSSYPPIDTS